MRPQEGHPGGSEGESDAAHTTLVRADHGGRPGEREAGGVWSESVRRAPQALSPKEAAHHFIRFTEKPTVAALPAPEGEASVIPNRPT